MKTKTAHIILTLAVLLLVPFFAESMDIHQESYTFRMNVTRDATCNTFVIAEELSAKSLPTVGCRLSLTLFDVGSSVLSPSAASAILSDLRKCKIQPDDSLQVTGYTCSLGPEKLNQELAQQRAEIVAALLLENGFTVAKVQGAGSQNLVTNDPQELFINRRVEIDLLTNENQEHPKE